MRLATGMSVQLADSAESSDLLSMLIRLLKFCCSRWVDTLGANISTCPRSAESGNEFCPKAAISVHVESFSVAIRTCHRYSSSSSSFSQAPVCVYKSVTGSEQAMASQTEQAQRQDHSL